VVVLGAENWLREAPQPAPEPDETRPVRVPWRLARELDLEPGAEYPLDAVLQAARERAARAHLTEARVRALLHLEPITAPLAGDLGWWRALADAYGAFLAAQGLDEPRLAPPTPGPGSPARWAYFQFGVPTVALDLWTLPAPADTAAAFADSVAAAVGPRPAREHELLKQRSETTDHEGWRPFAPVTLPDGRQALVGGPVPGAARTPAAYAAETRARALLPFLLELPAWLPRLELDALAVEDRGGGVLAVTATLRNPGRLPYPTEMGAVNRRPGPVVVTLAGATALQDPLRRVVPQLSAGGAVTLGWLVRAADAGALEVTARAPGLGSATAKGGQR
jgi:hypothetical protein